MTSEQARLVNFYLGNTTQQFRDIQLLQFNRKLYNTLHILKGSEIIMVELV